MKILIVNAGSSSLKYQLVDMQDESVLAKGLVENTSSTSICPPMWRPAATC